MSDGSPAPRRRLHAPSDRTSRLPDRTSAPEAPPTTPPGARSSTGPQRQSAAPLGEADRVLQVAIARLDGPEQRILTARFGLDGGGRATTLAEIGEELGLSPSRIRQMEQRALTKLRHPAFGVRGSSWL